MSNPRRQPKKPKKILQQSITAQEGVNLIERRLLQMGYLWYPTGGIEAGIDGHIEIRDSVTDVVTNATLRVQSKATKEPLGAEGSSSFSFVCDERDIDYWMKGTAPVILVRSRPDTEEAYWVSIKEYFADPTVRKDRKITFDKQRDRFDSSAKERLRQLAIPPEQGVFFAPAPIRERLLSNILPVKRFPATIYVAETPYREPGKLWAAARAAGAMLVGEWLLRDTRIMAVRDLTEEPWPRFCDRGTVEAFDSSEWATSEDRQKQNEFAELLGRCLTARLGRLPIRRDSEHRCYFFLRTRNLTARVHSYRSLKRMARKTVFQGYPSKQDPKSIAYYRHTAFEGQFRRYAGQWYLEIVPTYFFTSDGVTVHPFYESKLKGIKAQERNNAVRNLVMMWADILGDDRDDLFKASSYDLLQFGTLLSFELNAGLIDANWQPMDVDDDETDDPTLFDED